MDGSTVDPKLGLLVTLGVCAAIFAYRWWASARDAQRAKVDAGRAPLERPTVTQIAIGFVTDFLDTLGIGSFATTTALFKLTRMMPDEQIPGTLLTGHALAVVAEAFIFISVVRVEPFTLVSMIPTAVVGAWLGAGLVTTLPRRGVQIGMGLGLLAAASFMLMANLGLFPPPGEDLGFAGVRLAAALAVNALFGALLTVGIGNYAPSLIVFSLMGLDTRAAFPIMMGSGAFPAIAAGIRFIQKGRYDLRAALGLTTGGIPGVIVAGVLVKSLPLTTLRWVVVCVVVYTAIEMLRSARRSVHQLLPGVQR